MNNGLRLTLVTLTVGGGFTGVVVTLQSISQSENHSFLHVCLMAVFALLYGVVAASGLLFVLDARRTRLLMIALAVQIPWISTPVLVYKFAAGLHLTVGIAGAKGAGDLGFAANFLFGSTWEFALGRDDKVGFGVNIVALVLVILLKNSIKSSVVVPQSDVARVNSSGNNLVSRKDGNSLSVE